MKLKISRRITNSPSKVVKVAINQNCIKLLYYTMRHNRTVICILYAMELADYYICYSKMKLVTIYQTITNAPS